jgi:imidazolonepropionase-like amidohydrolase
MNNNQYFTSDLGEPLNFAEERNTPKSGTSFLQTIGAIFCISFISIIVSFSIFSGVFGLNVYLSSRESFKSCEVKKPEIINVYHQKKPVLINDATIYNGLIQDEFFKSRQSIYLEGGLIKCMGDSPLKDCKMSPDTEIYNMKDSVITPGLVDLHSHLGVYSFPGDLNAHADGNEMGAEPVTPFARVIDALRPTDEGIREIISGGITTSVVLPGSGNAIGGEGLAVKLRGKTVGEMKIQNQPRYLKFACGENPKRVYGSQNKMPATRMGNAWVMRKKFEEAVKLFKIQQTWDCSRGEKPQNLELEPLIALLKGDALLHNHCYEVVDFEMAIRVAKEFGYKITTFHHALESHMIPKILKENNISVATFADHWGFKVEAWNANVMTPKILYENGVSVILKSDHPVIHARNLILEAGKG